MRDGERHPDGADAVRTSDDGVAPTAGSSTLAGVAPVAAAHIGPPPTVANATALAETVAPAARDAARASTATAKPVEARRDKRADTKPGAGVADSSETAALKTQMPRAVATDATQMPRDVATDATQTPRDVATDATQMPRDVATDATQLPGNGAFAETLTGSAAAPAGAQARALAIRPPSARAVVESAETLDAAAALQGGGAGAGAGAGGGAGAAAVQHAATLQGPYTVADLPTLPRVDDATYAIGAEIARGGMGKILAARDRRLRREVVIKVMRRDYGRIDPRFEREALITARLQHPSIVRVYDAGVLGDGRAFYAMERVRGRSLEVVLGEARTLRARLALLPHAIAVCEALAYAHNEGIVHRDLKPSNVLLGPFGETVVIDWGLAKDLQAGDPEDVGVAAADASGADESGTRTVDSSSDVRAQSSRASSEPALTQVGAVMGTPSFMAPEQARGEPADERTDVYALGALLYTLLTGGPPVSGTSSDEVIDAVATGKRKRIAEVEPALPPELVSIVERAMAHEPRGRYRTAKAMAEDLRSFTAGKLVPSHAYTNWQLVKRWVARNRVPVGVAAAAAVMLAGLGVFSFVSIMDERDIANRQRVIAQQQEERAKQKTIEVEEKADRFIVGQAEAARVADPSLAAAWLKHLSPNALGWPAVGELARGVAADGLARELAGHSQDIELVAAAPDGTHVATASDDGTVRFWDVATGGSLEMTGHTGPIENIAIAANGRYVASAGTDHAVILFALDGTAPQRQILRGHTNTVRGVAFSPDMTRLASASEDGTLYVWDVATGRGDKVLTYTHSLRPVAWWDARTLLVGAFDGRIARVDVVTKRVSWLAKHKAEVRSLGVRGDRAYWMSSDEDGRVLLWDASFALVKELERHGDVAREIIFSADGRHAVTCGGDYDVHVYAIPSGALTRLAGNRAGVKDIDVNAEGLVTSAGIDGAVRVWKLDGTLLHTFRGHRAAVKGIAFAGRKVVSGAEDKAVRVWSLDAPPPPPTGVALQSWLSTHTNIETSAASTVERR